MKKHGRDAWDSSLRGQDDRRRRIHWATVAAQLTLPWQIKNPQRWKQICTKVAIGPDDGVYLMCSCRAMMDPKSHIKILQSLSMPSLSPIAGLKYYSNIRHYWDKKENTRWPPNFDSSNNQKMTEESFNIWGDACLIIDINFRLASNFCPIFLPNWVSRFSCKTCYATREVENVCWNCNISHIMGSLSNIKNFRLWIF